MGKEIPLWQALLVAVVLVTVSIWEMVFVGTGEAHIALIFTAVFAAVVSMINGWKWSVLETGIFKYVGKAFQAIIALMLVDLMRSVWIAGGVIPTIVYYGIDSIYPTAFLCTVFAICGFLSFFTGYSWALAGSAGVIFIDLGVAAGFPAGMVAGAVVSGVYLGENLSPFSDSVNFQAIAADVELYEHIKYTLRTGVPVMVICCIMYVITGMSNAGDNLIYGMTEMVKDEIAGEFIVNPIFIAVPLIVFFAALHFKAVIPAFFIGIVAGIACFMAQGEPMMSLIEILTYGTDYNDPFLSIIGEETPLQTNIFRSFGLQGMVWNLALIISAMTLAGIVGVTGMFCGLAESILTFANSETRLASITAATCISTNFIIADQYQAVLLPGILYRDTYEKKGLDTRKLSRCLGDAGAVTSALIPWNRCGIVMASTLGVAAWGMDGYGIYAYFCWLCPIFNIIYTRLNGDRLFKD